MFRTEDVLVERIQLHVEERYVQPHESDEESDSLDVKGRRLQRLAVEEVAHLGRLASHLQRHEGRDETGEDRKGNDARRPAEADLGLQVLEDDDPDYRA